MSKKHKKRFSQAKQSTRSTELPTTSLPIAPLATITASIPKPVLNQSSSVTYIHGFELRSIAIIFVSLLILLTTITIINNRTDQLNILSNYLSRTLHIEE